MTTVLAEQQVPPSKQKVGLWLVGASGAVASTVALGVAALRRGCCDTTGLVSALPPFAGADLVDPAAICIGGHEIRDVAILDTIRHLQSASGLFPGDLVRKCDSTLRAFQKDIRVGSAYGVAPDLGAVLDVALRPEKNAPLDVVSRLASDIASFRAARSLSCVVVVYLASSEPAMGKVPAHRTFAQLKRELGKRNGAVLPPSSLYALAAIEAGCPFVNFTPGLGIRVPAIREHAEKYGLCYMGSDGKTGETLVKSVLAPLFAMRNLEVLSWVGQNILGNQDGKTLRHPRTRRAKIESKDKTVVGIVKGTPTTYVSIDYVPSLDDWKVAWDYIHFRGFLDTRMNMQFTWQGSDSILAAPLVIDLARFAAYEHRAGTRGAMRHLACFFKDPLDVSHHDYPTQWAMLLERFGNAGRRPPHRPVERRAGHGAGA